MILAEKEGLSHHLDDSSDRILHLERQNREQEMQLVQSRNEVDEMKAANHSLSTRWVVFRPRIPFNPYLLYDLNFDVDHISLNFFVNIPKPCYEGCLPSICSTLLLQ